jgi:hypothetical protein
MRRISGVIPHVQAELHDDRHQRHGRNVAVGRSAGHACVHMNAKSPYADGVELRGQDGHSGCPERGTLGIQRGQLRRATRRRTRHGSQECRR